MKSHTRTVWVKGLVMRGQRLEGGITGALPVSFAVEGGGREWLWVKAAGVKARRRTDSQRNSRT